MIRVAIVLGSTRPNRNGSVRHAHGNAAGSKGE